ncbi:hypothetical protein BDP27DRAFT_1365481 [Rhodocollybia butyracea]|uniref:Uncharacterized protein n=1 Tax=Rhodocollybia butyracea TaxID=206335 RepID=A0A9P5U4F7_9AGAR|nr:hypothetical protein BDP27DRAFT_1365481 [Rhodocollybia butyracea]
MAASPLVRPHVRGRTPRYLCGIRGIWNKKSDPQELRAYVHETPSGTYNHTKTIQYMLREQPEKQIEMRDLTKGYMKQESTRKEAHGSSISTRFFEELWSLLRMKSEEEFITLELGPSGPACSWPNFKLESHAPQSGRVQVAQNSSRYYNMIQWEVHRNTSKLSQRVLIIAVLAMMATQSPTVIVDNAKFNISGPWSVLNNGAEYTGYKDTSLSTPVNFSSTNPCMIYLNFTGLSASIMGASEPGSVLVDGKHIASFFSVVLDGGTPLQINVSDVWDGIIYETPSLSEGFHLLEMNLSSPLNDLYLDYALINPGPSTPLVNISDASYQALFVNYTDPTIVYKGQWNDSSGLPFKTTFNSGATIQFPLPGYNVTLLGHITPGLLFDEFQLGNTTLNVTIDDRLPVTYTWNNYWVSYGGWIGSLNHSYDKEKEAQRKTGFDLLWYSRTEYDDVTQFCQREHFQPIIEEVQKPKAAVLVLASPQVAPLPSLLHENIAEEDTTEGAVQLEPLASSGPDISLPLPQPESLLELIYRVNDQVDAMGQDVSTAEATADNFRAQHNNRGSILEPEQLLGLIERLKDRVHAIERPPPYARSD